MSLVLATWIFQDQNEIEIHENGITTFTTEKDTLFVNYCICSPLANMAIHW